MKKKPSKSSEKMNGAAGDHALREHLLFLLRGGGAHLSFEEAIAKLPAGLRGVKPPNLPFSAWRLLEHLRIAQWDIVEFTVNPKHVSPAWPAGYWPEGDAPPDDAAWKKSIQQFRRDLERMQALVAKPGTDLYAPIPHGEGQTILREALLVADHNAYHLGELVVVRRLLGAWKS
ncbi:MAG: DinB family protein [Terriglobia bacterium]|jgi:hypothetical protein